MAQPTTPEEAAQRQLDNYEAGTFDRYASLKDGYEMRQVPEHGMGVYPVNIETGEVCEAKPVWYLDGRVLLCPVCFEEGT